MEKLYNIDNINDNRCLVRYYNWLTSLVIIAAVSNGNAGVENGLSRAAKSLIMALDSDGSADVENGLYSSAMSLIIAADSECKY